jgi:hypothetical protein
MAESNSLNPTHDRVGLAGNVWIFSFPINGSDSTIKAAAGTAGTDYAAGSIAVCTGGSAIQGSTPGVFVLVTTTWTQLTIN